MLGREVARQALGFSIDDEVDAALAVKHHILRAVPGHQCEAHFFKQGFKHIGLGCSELDELEAAQAHGVFKKIAHMTPLAGNG